MINLTKTNRLLYFRATRVSTIELLEPDAVEVFDRLVEPRFGGWAFFIPPEIEADPQPFATPVLLPSRRTTELLTDKPDAQSLTNALKALRRRAEAIFMDTGLSVLYLAVGMLRWKPSPEDVEAQSPLLLVPVVLQQETPREPFRLLRAEEDPTINPALAVKLKNEFGIELPTIDEVDDISVSAFLGQVRSLLRLQPAWQVEPRLILTTFSFHKEAMYRDLQDNEQVIAAHGAIVALAEGPGTKQSFDFDLVPDKDLDEIVPAEQMSSILDADASQRQCIHAARSGKSFVMDGPPGTGKSQTIANIIAELMVAGKNVLFVSEKAAALEVVHARLRAAGLAEYLLELHSHKATRREVAQELGRALRTQPRARGEFPEADIARLVGLRKELSAYAEAMNETRLPLGMSLFKAVGRIAVLQPLPAAPWPTSFRRLDTGTVQGLVAVAASLGRAWGPVDRGPEFVWRGVRTDRYDVELKREIEAQLESASEALAIYRESVSEAARGTGLAWNASNADAERLVLVLDHLENRPPVPSHWLSAPAFGAVNKRVDELQALTTRLRQAEDALKADGIEDPANLPVATAADYSLHSKRLLEALPGLRPELASTPAVLSELADFLEASHQQLMNIELLAKEIGVAFGIHEESLSLRRAAEMAELGLMTRKSSLPEPAWLNPLVTRRLTEAAGVLPTVAQDYRSRRDVLTQTFTDEVLALDLEGLSDRFKSVHRGPFKFLRASYRSDRRTLATCTRAGKLTKQVVARIDEALAWKTVTAELTVAEQRHAAILAGSYDRHHTDFAALTSAVETAHRAVAIAGNHADPSALAKQISRGGTPDPQVQVWAQDLDQRIQAWVATATRLLGSSADSFSTMPLTAVRQDARQLRPTVSLLGLLLTQVGEKYARNASRSQAEEWSQWRLQIAEVTADFAKGSDADSALLGPAFIGPDSNWDLVRNHIRWASRLVELLGGPVEQLVADSLLRATLVSSAIVKSRSRWSAEKASLVSRFEPDGAQDVDAILEQHLEVGTHFLSRLTATVSDIEEWIAFQKAKADLDQAGLEKVIAFCVDKRVGGPQVESIVERAILERWVNDQFKHDSRLKDLRPEEREHCVNEFRRLDRKLIGAAAARAISQCNNRRPRAGIGQAAIIDREANKQRRHMPVKELLKQAGEVAKALKPCFMMSPLSVSQFIDSSMRFDAVIFDEASQVKPADAVNCIYRGSQLVVAGDNKQLPPTAFWEAVTGDDGDEYVEDQLEDFQSVLDLCKGSGAYRSLSLMWHYRSQHESLITYSNHSFYEGSLITFPGAVQHAPDLGVHLIRVPGVYRRSAQRDNPVEARAVADRVFHHAETHPHLSLGVVTFSEAQANAVEGEIDRRRSSRRDLDAFFKPDRLRGFFVKNLESVQGDERDVMIFSLGYGPDEFGRFTMNFGPLNQKGGQRRLNVAITRARRRVEVVSSVRASDFLGQIQEGGGVWHLRRYLDFLERGVPVLGLPTETQRRPDSELEEEVARVIQSWGFEVVPQVGTASYRVDLGVKLAEDTSRYVLGVECDGAMYHSSLVARDRDRIRQQVLEGLGWRLHRVWAPAWFRDRDREEARLRAAIDAAAAAPGPVLDSDEIAIRPSVEVTAADVDEVELGAPPAWTIPYELASPSAPRRPVEIHLPEAAQDLRRMIEQVVRVEGPVAESLVIRRVREAWGVGRSGHRIQEAFEDQLRWLSRNGTVNRIRGFVQLRNQELTAVRTPTDDPGSRRKVDEVPPDEIELALSYVSAEALAAPSDDLTDAAARIFGWQRRGVDITDALGKALGRLIRQGKLRKSGANIEWSGGELNALTERLVVRRQRPDMTAGPSLESVANKDREDTPPDTQSWLTASFDSGRHEDSAEIPPNIQNCITAEGHLTLATELDDLTASGGDRGRISKLRDLLERVVVIPLPYGSERVRLGTQVTFAQNGGKEETYLIVGPIEAAASQGKLNVLSPVGGALWNRKVGDTVEVVAPGNGSYSIKITAITA